MDFETLEVYRDYLAEHLSFPFEAVWETEAGPFSNRREKVVVKGLGDPDEDYRIDDHWGKWRSRRGIKIGSWWQITVSGFGILGNQYRFGSKQ